MKQILLLLICCFTSTLFAQVTGVDYLMKYNCETNQYDVHIVILEGSATSIPHRAQFNCQISLVVPTGENVVITNKYMPLQNNQQYTSNAPMDWSLGSPIYAPEAQPENDFYSITPKLSPASFYNDLATGDVVKLFSFIAGSSGEYNSEVRFFRNGEDPDDTAPGMQGGNFSNGFTLGGATNIYNENIEEGCGITDVEESRLTDVHVFPNPFQDELTIELTQDVKHVQVIDGNGRVHYQTGYKSKGILKINAMQFPAGVYYVRLQSENGTGIHKVVKF